MKAYLVYVEKGDRQLPKGTVLPFQTPVNAAEKGKRFPTWELKYRGKHHKIDVIGLGEMEAKSQADMMRRLDSVVLARLEEVGVSPVVRNNESDLNRW